MNAPIKTNQLVYSLNREKLEEYYDIFAVKTSEKYFQSGAAIIDAPALEKNVCAVRFVGGNCFYVLMRHELQNKKRLREALANAKGANSVTITPVASEELEDWILLQLLLNSLGSAKRSLLRFNNLTGHLYCFHPDWSKPKNGIIWRVPCLEISVTQECFLKFDVRTFTSERLKKKITFGKRKFEDYPKYIMSTKNTLRRRLKGEKESAFIQRQIDGKKESIDFLNVLNFKAFQKSKMGIVANVVQSFNKNFSGIAEINFTEITEYASVEYDRAAAKENTLHVSESLKTSSICIVDMIQDEASLEFCERIKHMLDKKYAVDIRIRKRIDKEKRNLCLIHNAAYYQNENDPYQKAYPGAAVQHITWEDFAGLSDKTIEKAVSSVVHEMLIKFDLQKGKITLFDWEKLGFTEEIAFGTEAEDGQTKRYFFMKIHPDGSFEITEQEPSLFEQTEYSDCAFIFDEARKNSETVKGLIRDKNGNINIIKDTGWLTIPEIFRIEEELRNGNTALRGKNRQQELFPSVLNIHSFEKNGSLYYFVGAVGLNMKYAIHAAANIRRIETYQDSPLLFQKLLPLMNVSFVRNEQLTVIPFPFKYLREYIRGYVLQSTESAKEKLC